MCNSADVDIFCSGEVALSVSDKLNIGIAGSGTVHYYGSPAVSQNTSGISSIKQISATIP